MNKAIRCGYSYSTISVASGKLFTHNQCGELCGSLSSLSYTLGTRVWTATAAFESSGKNVVMSIANNGGPDMMYSMGEPSSFARTMGHQRPALNQ